MSNNSALFRSPISRRLILYVVLCSSVLTLLLTIFQLYREYQADLNLIERQYTQIEKVHIDAITESLWAADIEKLSIIAKGISNLRDLNYVAIVEEESILISYGAKPEAETDIRSFPLIYIHRDSPLEIGKVNVAFDINAVNQRLLDRALVILINNGIKTSLVVIFMALIFYQVVVRHLTHISEYLTKLEVGGSRESLELERQETSSDKKDELDLVVASINQYLGEIDTHLIKRKQTEGKLFDSNKELDALNKELDERVKTRTRDLEFAVGELEAFTYSVSHDLRSPLRSLDGFSQAILEDYSERLDDTGRDYLNRIRLAAVRMGELIDDLLNLSRISKRDLIIEPVDLSKIAETIRAKVLEVEGSRKIVISISDKLEVDGDPKLLRIALENLMGNAVKYTGPRDIANIQFGELESDDNKKIFYIKDNGVGFDMTYVDKIFLTFQRLHHSREFPGNGIGLSIVERVIKKHGGSIWAESKVDEGTTFYFKL